MFAKQRIQLKTPEQFALMREAGLLVADTLAKLRAAVAPGVSTKDLDELAESNIRAAGGTPNFKGYYGYPATICASVNDQVVHAIPSADQVLAEGDIISIDCGAIIEGWHGDSAITVPVGEVDPALTRMIDVAEDAMWAGIAAAGTGRRLTDISYAIEQVVRAGGQYGIVEGYGGHGIGTEMHQDPHILNYGRPGKGPKLVTGMALAIEPMITMGRADVVELDDQWTVVTADHSLAAHVEHSVALCSDGLWVLTAPDGGRSRLGDLASALATPAL
ncbi:type I methionyl aminopeptidase [Actinocatenispora rupis]|uniref:Methionine aminopeptidase n=1 Tax=Actinocatenispora rupis TaxID=519421 RepID=A0A8J3J7M8_9ACTN|nr:type I methionyl aminopeptidase [Actinocatenispora rupis]GID11604.1 methionine aminopeptidase [Actinocatenispora rupis]